MLQLELEYLSGVCFAAESADGAADWPPQPDRMFSALVAAWGARGKKADEQSALEWLERQPPPSIDATPAFERRIVTVFVPPNAVTAKIGEISKMPSHRGRQPRRFQAVRPHRATMRFLWSCVPEEHVLMALDGIARDVVYLGHSASLVRARFFVDATADTVGFESARRGTYDGRLAELEHAYQAGHRLNPGQPLRTEPKTSAHQSEFGEAWLVLSAESDWTPAPQAMPRFAKRLRDALVEAIGGEGAVSESVSGVAPDGSPSTQPHLAVVPLLDVGWEYSIGRPMGLALVCSPSDVPLLVSAIRKLARAGDDPCIALRLDSATWELAPVDDSPKASLRPERWIEGSKTLRWATATPIVLDRHPKGRTGDERNRDAEAVVAAACEHIGLPRPREIRLTKQSALSGAAPAYPSSGAPPWTAWLLTDRLRGRPLTHAVIDFVHPVHGPVILGAGRYLGLGLCLPIETREKAS